MTTDVNYDLPPEVVDVLRTLTRRIGSIEYDVRSLSRESGAAFQSVETGDGSVVLYDDDGNIITEMGEDGFVTNTTLYGAPTPEAPDVTGGFNSLIIAYDGTFLDGDWDENQVDHVEIHVCATSGETLTDQNQVGTFVSSNGGVFTFPWNALDGGRWVYLQAVTVAGEEGAASSGVFAVPSTIATTDGNPPTGTPVVTVSGGIQSVIARWPAVTNADPVTYRIYAKVGSAPAITGTTDLLATSPQTSIVINRTPAGATIAPSDVVHVRVTVFDADGDGPTSTDQSASPITINSVDITGNAVTTGKIAPSAITSALIADGTIATGDIASAQITNALMAVNAINTTNLVDSAVTAIKITDGTITTAKIGSSQITNTLIADNSISTPKIQANAITASQVAAGAITANKLLITAGGGNLLSNTNSGILTGSGAQAGASDTTDATTGFYTTSSIKVTLSATAFSGYQRIGLTLQPNTTYTWSAWLKLPSGAGSFPTGGITMAVSGAGVTSPPTGPTTTVTGSWVRLTYTFTTNATATPVNLVADRVAAGTAGEFFNIDAMQLEIGDVPTAYMPKADEILPGTVVAAMIAANTITAGQIASSTITATQIAASTITGDRIAANTIAASRLILTNLNNIVDDPGFELGSSSWVFNNGAAIATIADPANGGTKIARIPTLTSNTPGVQYAPQANGIPVLPGETFYFSHRLRKTTTGTTGAARTLLRSTLDGASQVDVVLADTLLSTLTQNVWTTISGMVTVPAGKNFTMPRVQSQVIATGDTLEVDDWIFRRATSAELVVDGAITTAKLAAGAVTANKLLVTVGGGNLQGNSSYERSTFGTGGGQVGINARWSFSTAQKWTGSQSMLITSNVADTGNEGFQNEWCDLGQDAAGKIVTFSHYFYRVGGTLPIRFDVEYANASFTSLGNGTGVTGAANTQFLDVPNTTTGAWQRFSWSSVAPANTRFCRARVYYASGSYPGTDSFHVDATQVEIGDVPSAYAPKVSEILPGTIVSSMVATDTLLATNIAADAITSSEIAANTITAGDIAANTITAGQIAATTITAAQIATGTITATQIASGTITATQIASGTITATQLSATAIDAMTITGATLQTAASGGRVVMANSGTQEFIKFYTGNAGETAPGSIQTTASPSMGIVITSPRAATSPVKKTQITLDDFIMVIQADEIDVLVGANGFGITGGLGVSQTIHAEGTIDNWSGPGNTTHDRTIESDILKTITPNNTANAANCRINTVGGALLLSTSLSRFKINKQEIGVDEAKKVLNLKPITFFDKDEYKDHKGKKGAHRTAGVTAEDVEKHLPDLAAYDEPVGGKLLGVDYDRMATYLIPLVRDLYAQIEDLQAKVAALV